MSKLLPALAARAAVVATVTAAAAVSAVLPAVTATAAPARPAVTSSSAAPAPPAGVRVVTTPVAKAAVSTSALDFAMSKIGAPYRWGAAGPDAFDCSGLVKWSFGQAGVSLPRTSRAMSRVGTPVAKADLRPGDLVFFYTPVHHVAIYVGNGEVVHASTSSSPVKVAELAAMPFHSARRI